MSWKDKAGRAFQAVTKAGAIAPLFNVFQGRCTFFACVFAFTGVYGWLHGKDLTSYALFVTSIQGLLVLHSWKSDIAEQRQIGSQQTVVINTSK
jgi:hypothetical protein